jgi:hypothetical protein
MEEQGKVEPEEQKEKQKEEQEKPEEKNILPRNIIREYAKSFSPFLKKSIGHYYLFIHHIIISVGCFVFFFSNRIFYLSVLLNMIILDCMSIVFIHDCPLTMLEKKYLDNSLVESRQKSFKDMGIVYECEHEYEKQLELLINLWSFIALKIFYIIIMDMTNIKLV